MDPTPSTDRNGWSISEQGKHTDFLMEIGPASNDRWDTTEERNGLRQPGNP